MNHLTKNEVSAWIAGVAERTPQQERHVAECEICSAQIEQVQAALVLFRASVRQWAQQTDKGVTAQIGVDRALDWQTRPRAISFGRWRWAGVAAALVLATVVGLRVSEIREQQDQLRELERAHADDVLLQQVDAQISRDVPASMEPLTSLVSWKESSYGEEGSSEQKSGEKNQ